MGDGSTQTLVLEPFISNSANKTQRSQNVSPFEYNALPGHRFIRVLKLEPGSWNSPIRCSLEPHDLDTGILSFEAMSYVWGTSVDRKKVICDSQRFSVTTNLFDALQTFRHSDQVRILWADAICINQNDAEEKNHQVPLMRLIYSKASEVLIWLGHEDPETVRYGLNALCRIVNREYSKEQQGGELAAYIWNGHVADTSIVPNTSSEGIEAQDFESLGPLFACTWFTRVWVIQEAALASAAVMFWGNATIDFRRVGFVAEYVTKNKLPVFMRYNTPTSNVGICNCGSIHSFREFPPNTRGFLYLLQSSDAFGVTDPRDRIFGLLGLRTSDSDPDSGELFIKPNYNLSVLEVYENVVTKFLVDQKKVQVLSLVQHGPVIPSDKKSWATDWDKRRHNVFGQEPRKTTSDMPPGVCKPVCDIANCVAIQGIAVDDIGSVMSDEADSIPSKDINMARRLKTLMEKLREDYSSETVAWTLTAGFSTHYTLVNDHGAHLTEYNAFSEWDFEQGAPVSESDIHPYFRLVDIVLSPRRLFTTTKGLLGLGPMIIQEGDIVSVLFGGNVPYALRPVGDHYRLVGECYFHSIMEGQGVEEWKKSGEPAKNFHIY